MSYLIAVTTKVYLRISELEKMEMDIDKGLATVTDNLQQTIDKLAPER